MWSASPKQTLSEAFGVKRTARKSEYRPAAGWCRFGPALEPYGDTEPKDFESFETACDGLSAKLRTMVCWLGFRPK